MLAIPEMSSGIADADEDWKTVAFYVDPANHSGAFTYDTGTLEWE